MPIIKFSFSHGLELTDDGRHFLAHAYSIEAAVANAQDMPRLADVGGALVIAATPTLVAYFLPEHNHRLSGLHPGLCISMLELDRRSDRSHRSMVGNGQSVAIASDKQYRPWSLERQTNRNRYAAGRDSADVGGPGLARR